MFCSIKSPAQRRYVLRMWVAAGLCVLLALVAKLALRFGHLSGLTAYLVAVLPALPIVGALVATGVYLEEEKDEFQRNLLVQSLLGGIGALLALTTMLGNLEGLTGMPHLSLIWIYPIFWLFAGISFFVVRLRYR